MAKCLCAIGLLVLVSLAQAASAQSGDQALQRASEQALQELFLEPEPGGDETKPLRSELQDEEFNLSINESEQALNLFYDALAQSTALRARDGAEMFEISPQADANAERLANEGVDLFVVGATASPVDFFNEVTMLITLAEPYPHYTKRTRGRLTVDDNPVRCSGVFMSDQTILTAGHCVCALNLDTNVGSERSMAAWGLVSSEVGLAKKGHNAGLDPDNPVTLFNPNFCQTFRQNGAIVGLDLALVHLHPSDVRYLPTRLKGAFTRKSATLATPSIYFSKDIFAMTVVGYGISEYSFEPPSTELYYPKVGASVPIADAYCGLPSSQQNFRCKPGEEIVLVDQIFGNDTCNGDSGGPAFIRYFHKYYLAGITSRAALPGGNCGSGGIYTLLTPTVINWINRNTRSIDPTF